MSGGIDDGINDGVHKTTYNNRNPFPNWFGKGCKFFIGIWEENEITGGPNYQEYEPEITYCSHHRNYSETEGNCRKERCPLKKNI